MKPELVAALAFLAGGNPSLKNAGVTGMRPVKDYRLPSLPKEQRHYLQRIGVTHPGWRDTQRKARWKKLQARQRRNR